MYRWVNWLCEIIFQVQGLEPLFPVQGLEKTVQVLSPALPWYFKSANVVPFGTSDWMILVNYWWLWESNRKIRATPQLLMAMPWLSVVKRLLTDKINEIFSFIFQVTQTWRDKRGNWASAFASPFRVTIWAHVPKKVTGLIFAGFFPVLVCTPLLALHSPS